MKKTHIQPMLKSYADKKTARFHMPGHKGKVFETDITELSVTDNLNNPESHIRQAQQSLSKSYSSIKSYFLVNGATSGIHAMLKYTSLINKKPILTNRNCHKSVVAGCMLYGIDVEVIDDYYDNELQVFTYNEQKIIDKIINKKYSAVVITSVDYFGRVIDVSRLFVLCKEQGVLLLCDEAHGSHFHISDMLPSSAIDYADICVHSPHKTLSALTQSAYLHISSDIDVDKMEHVISSIQTTSPSSILVQSMDDARYDADTMKKSWETRAKQVSQLAKKIQSIDGVDIMSDSSAKKCGYYQKDVTRLVIDIGQLGNGILIGKELEDKYNIFMEMCTYKYLVGILTPWDDDKWDVMLYNAIKEISKQKRPLFVAPKYPVGHQRAISMIDEQSARWEKVHLKRAHGKIAATSIGSYPPGVPLVLPGEIITEQIIKYLLMVKKCGGDLFGISDGYINSVIKN